MIIFFILFFFFFFFNDTATTEIYTLSLHDALPFFLGRRLWEETRIALFEQAVDDRDEAAQRSEEHTSELQSRFEIVCRLRLEKKKVILWNSQRENSKTTYKTTDYEFC